MLRIQSHAIYLLFLYCVLICRLQSATDGFNFSLLLTGAMLLLLLVSGRLNSKLHYNM